MRLCFAMNTSVLLICGGRRLLFRTRARALPAFLQPVVNGFPAVSSFVC